MLSPYLDFYITAPYTTHWLALFKPTAPNLPFHYNAFFRWRFAVLLSLDGNFDHLRLKHAGSGDQPVPGAFSYFLSPDEVAATKRSTEQAMGKNRRPFANNEATDPDAILPGLSLPEHIYSGCEKRFFAADEENKKAETSVFSDTGLMAMVC